MEEQTFKWELVNPESGEIIEFSGKVVDAGFFLKLVKDQIREYDKEIRNLLATEAWEMIQADPTLGMTRHFEGQRGKASVNVKRDPKFETKDILHFKKMLGDEQFNQLFKEEIGYKARIQPLKTFLKTKTDNDALETIKAMIQARFDYAELNATIKFEPRKEARE